VKVPRTCHAEPQAREKHLLSFTLKSRFFVGRGGGLLRMTGLRCGVTFAGPGIPREKLGEGKHLKPLTKPPAGEYTYTLLFKAELGINLDLIRRGGFACPT
jgi:hypothetical protein